MTVELSKPFMDNIIDYSDDRAMMTIHFLGEDNTWVPITAMFDSGSDLCVLPYDYAVKLQWYGPQIPLLAREVVGSVAMLKTDVIVAVMGKAIRVPMITSQFIMDPLLGMTGVKEQFIIVLRPNGFSFTPIESE